MLPAFPECGLNVPHHIQPCLVDGLVKPGAMSAVEALYVIGPEGSTRHKRHFRAAVPFDSVISS